MKNRRMLGLVALAAIGSPLFAAGEFNPTEFIARIVNFIIFFGGLGYLLRSQVTDFFVGRKKKIAEDLAMAEKSREEAKRRLDEIQEKMKNLDDELADIEQRAREDAEREKQRLLENAREDASRLLEQAKADIENRSREAMASLRAEVVDKAVKEAEHMVRSSMTDAERKQVFNRFTDKLGA